MIKILLILYNIFFLFFSLIISKLKTFFLRCSFALNKKYIDIPFFKVFKLSNATLANLINVNKKSYEPEVLKFINNNIKNKNFFFDIGAHYGFYTLNLEKNFQKIYCFEANPDSFNILNYNLKKKKIKNVKTFNNFVANSENKVDFLISSNSYLCQLNKKSFLYQELTEFCSSSFYFKNEIEYNQILYYCYHNLVNETFIKNYFYLFSNLLKNYKTLSLKNIRNRLKIFKRYLKYHDRYICKTIQIKPYKIDKNFKENYDQSFVKIDVEGAELEVIHSMKNFIKKNKPDIFCEIGNDHNNVVKSITSLGYNCKEINWKSFYFRPFGKR